MEYKIAGSYVIKEKLHTDTHRSLYLVVHSKSNKKFMAKIEKETDSVSKLHYESRLHRLFKNHEGFIRTYCFCNEGNKNFLIMDLLGRSISHLFNFHGKKLQLDFVLNIGIQLVTRLEIIHSKNYVHRDIRPENMVMGADDKSETIFLIDFETMKLFKESKTGLHIKFRKGCKYQVSSLFSSIWTSQGFQYSRRDDLESLMFVLVYLVKGQLPWGSSEEQSKPQNADDGYCNRNENTKTINKWWLKGNDEDLRKTGKLNTGIDKICIDLPSEFLDIFRYIRCLNFDTTPDYSYLRRLLQESYKKCTFNCISPLFSSPLTVQENSEGINETKIEKSLDLEFNIFDYKSKSMSLGLVNFDESSIYSIESQHSLNLPQSVSPVNPKTSPPKAKPYPIKNLPSLSLPRLP